MSSNDGTIQAVDPDTGEVTPFLDVVNKSNADKGIELGLLGMAFHPDFETNRRFWIYYTDVEHDAAVVEYLMGSNGLPDLSSENRIMEIDRLPNGLRHNAGMMQFGPDGYLYIASGDNGQYDVNPQDPNTKKGAIMRIDVDSGDPYGTPADNPWADGSGLPRYGLSGSATRGGSLSIPSRTSCISPTSDRALGKRSALSLSNPLATTLVGRRWKDDRAGHRPPGVTRAARCSRSSNTDTMRVARFPAATSTGERRYRN